MLGSYLNICNLNISYLSHDAIAEDAKTEFHHAIEKRYGNDPKTMVHVLKAGGWFVLACYVSLRRCY